MGIVKGVFSQEAGNVKDLSLIPPNPFIKNVDGERFREHFSSKCILYMLRQTLLLDIVLRELS